MTQLKGYIFTRARIYIMHNDNRVGESEYVCVGWVWCFLEGNHLAGIMSYGVLMML